MKRFGSIMNYGRIIKQKQCIQVNLIDDFVGIFLRQQLLATPCYKKLNGGIGFATLVLNWVDGVDFVGGFSFHLP